VSAAGIGSRLGMNTPKCLVQVGGRAIIDHQLELLADFREVRIVVGFMEERVIEHVRKLRSDVIFVRNPSYRSTSTLQSLSLGAKHLKRPFIIIDGDLIFEKRSFDAFVAACTETPLLGVAAAGADDAVFVQTERDDRGRLIVTRFQRAPRTGLEWIGIAYLDNSHLEYKNCWTYQILERKLPIAAKQIQEMEVDTPNDLERANRALLNGGWGTPVLTPDLTFR
jgi:choline kinase